MLKLVLAKAQALGIERVLITADEDNYPSKRVIEANDGPFEEFIQR
ncbi:hypothetical protein [Celerinatantimonas diazotrophica]|uniref:Acetyltransferase (GNAT) family protein n=1 Tax=Celerinatantimonas diazotrophica TaxID=412034 RepID=A0A4R1JM05_9GAMM|nr:hypothetical protein EV690_2177 [Celerinatantimonas diazotrophica]CAG9296221.1 hypothetical protein CEDIAZO_01368 [Celerinatantimonas diazotrophica]